MVEAATKLAAQLSNVGPLVSGTGVFEAYHWATHRTLDCRLRQSSHQMVDEEAFRVLLLAYNGRTGTRMSDITSGFGRRSRLAFFGLFRADYGLRAKNFLTATTL